MWDLNNLEVEDEYYRDQLKIRPKPIVSLYIWIFLNGKICRISPPSSLKPLLLLDSVVISAANRLIGEVVQSQSKTLC